MSQQINMTNNHTKKHVKQKNSNNIKNIRQDHFQINLNNTQNLQSHSEDAMLHKAALGKFNLCIAYFEFFTN